MKNCMLKISEIQLGVEAHTFNTHSWEAEAGKSLEFEDRLVCKVGSRTAEATQSLSQKNNQSNKTNKHLRFKVVKVSGLSSQE